MGIKEVYESRKQIVLLINLGDCSEDAIARHQTLGSVLELIEEECPEVLEEVEE